MSLFRGSAPALITPFCKDGIDFEALGKLIEFQIEQGSDALVVLGTTGEPPTMSQSEKQAVIEFAVKRVGKRVPLIVGTGANSTAATIEASQRAQALGADGLLVVTPYYNKCTQRGLISHYTAIADSVDIPIILYNVPARTGVNMLPSTVAELSSHKNITALKEASGNAEQMAELARVTEGKLDLLSGEDALVFSLLALGGTGVISVVANIAPRHMHNLCSAYFEGNIKVSRQIQLSLLPLVRALFMEVNPIPVKKASELLGLCNGELRLPLTEMEQKNVQVLQKEMQALGLI